MIRVFQNNRVQFDGLKSPAILRVSAGVPFPYDEPYRTYEWNGMLTTAFGHNPFQKWVMRLFLCNEFSINDPNKVPIFDVRLTPYTTSPFFDRSVTNYRYGNGPSMSWVQRLNLYVMGFKSDSKPELFRSSLDISVGRIK